MRPLGDIHGLVCGPQQNVCVIPGGRIANSIRSGFSRLVTMFASDRNQSIAARPVRRWVASTRYEWHWSLGLKARASDAN